MPGQRDGKDAVTKDEIPPPGGLTEVCKYLPREAQRFYVRDELDNLGQEAGTKTSKIARTSPRNVASTSPSTSTSTQFAT